MNKIAVLAIILLIVGAGIWVFALTYKPSGSLTGKTVSQTGDVKTFNVDSANLRFYIDRVENPEIMVKEGDMVIINFKSSEGYHDWVVDEFDARTVKINPGGTASVGFIADKKGNFTYYCSVGKHRQNGMEGKFIVE